MSNRKRRTKAAPGGPKPATIQVFARAISWRFDGRGSSAVKVYVLPRSPLWESAAAQRDKGQTVEDGNIGAIFKPFGQLVFAERLRRGEQQRLEQPKLMPAFVK